MKKQLLSSLSIFLIVFTTLAQQQRVCASDEVLARQNANPQVKQLRAQIEKQTQKFLAEGSKANRRADILTIPVIVHVIYRTSQENISDAQIQSQIDVMNEDFRKLNSDVSLTPAEFAPVAADIQIEFTLAQITRKQTTKTSWGTNDAMKRSSSGGVDVVDPEHYLNIWVCNIGGGILGYAQFPGGSSSTDGVVISPPYFGSADKEPAGETFYLSAPFHKGRTATHEVGHYLNLRHIWGDGGCSVDDFVNDTPIAGAPNYGCPSYPSKSCSSNGGFTSDMFMNYMDYVDDECMFMFSTGQKARMDAIFVPGGARDELGTVVGNDPDDTEAPSVPTALTASNVTSTSVTLSWTASTDNVGVSGYNVYQNDTFVSSSILPTITISGLNPSTTYTFSVSAKDGAGNISAQSSPVSVTTEVFTVTYCETGGSTVTFEWIDYVELGSISNSTGANGGYGDFTSLSTELVLGSSNDVYFSAGFSGTLYSENWSVYIDYNQDGDFTDSGETLVSGTTSDGAIYYGTFTVPTTATLGETRMRVVMRWNSTPSSCGTFSYGEVEDYTVIISSADRGAATIARVNVPEGEKIGTDMKNELFSVYPTPASDVLSFNFGEFREISAVRMFTLGGELVKSGSLDGNKSVNISDLKKGLYLVEIVTEKGKFNAKFIKQ